MTTAESRLIALERRVARLEAERERRERKAAGRRVVVWHLAYSSLMGTVVALIALVGERLL